MPEAILYRALTGYEYLEGQNPYSCHMFIGDITVIEKGIVRLDIPRQGDRYEATGYIVKDSLNQHSQYRFINVIDDFQSDITFKQVSKEFYDYGVPKDFSVVIHRPSFYEVGVSELYYIDEYQWKNSIKPIFDAYVV